MDGNKSNNTPRNRQNGLLPMGGIVKYNNINFPPPTEERVFRYRRGIRMKLWLGLKTNKSDKGNNDVARSEFSAGADRCILDLPDGVSSSNQESTDDAYEDLGSGVKILDNLDEIRRTCMIGVAPSILEELRKPIELEFRLDKDFNKRAEHPAVIFKNAHSEFPCDAPKTTSDPHPEDKPGKALCSPVTAELCNFDIPIADSHSECNFAEDIMVLNDILSSREQNQNPAIPEACGKESKDTIRKDDDTPMFIPAEKRIREILGIDKKKVNASCSSDDIRSRDTDATLTKPALTRSQNSAPDISRAFRTADGSDGRVRIESAGGEDLSEERGQLQNILDRQVKKARRSQLCYVKDKRYSNYVESLIHKSESDSWFVKVLSSVPQTAAMVSEIKLFHTTVKLFEAVQKIAPQDTIVVKIMNTTYDGDLTHKGTYTCATFDLRWSRTFFFDGKDAVFETRIAKGSTSYDYNSKKVIKFRFSDAIIRQIQCIESKIDLFSVEKTLFSKRKGLIATASVSLEPLLFSRIFSRRVNLLSPITRKKTKWSLNLYIEIEKPFLEVKIRKKNNNWVQVDPKTPNPTFCKIESIVKSPHIPDLEGTTTTGQNASDNEEYNVLIEDTFYDPSVIYSSKVLDNEINAFEERLSEIGDANAEESRILSDKIRSYKKRALELSGYANKSKFRPKERVSQLEESLRSTKEILDRLNETDNSEMYKTGLQRMMFLRDDVGAPRGDIPT